MSKLTIRKVAVLGAGPAGLMAARRIAEGGRSVVIVERAPTVGGMAGSFEVAGVRVDHGSHRLHRVLTPRLEADLRRLPEAEFRRLARALDILERVARPAAHPKKETGGR